MITLFMLCYFSAMRYRMVQKAVLLEKVEEEERKANIEKPKEIVGDQILTSFRKF